MPYKQGYSTSVLASRIFRFSWFMFGNPAPFRKCPFRVGDLNVEIRGRDRVIPPGRNSYTTGSRVRTDL